MFKLKDFILDTAVHITQMFIWLSLRIAILFFGKLKVTGLEELKGIKGPVIFAPNHSSHLDPPLLGTALSFNSRFFPIYFVTLPYKEYTNISTSLFTKILYTITPFALTGSVPIEPGVKNYKVSLKRHIDLLKRGKSVCIFPEGKVTLDGTIGKARGGVAYMADETSVPIVPVLIQGTYNLSLKSFFRDKPYLRVRYGRPIDVKDLMDSKLPEVERYQKAADRLMTLISQSIT
jgi:1-acyl-sn-glycerol-3-phosphate acyltransferase